jgi:hypothetical protein
MSELQTQAEWYYVGHYGQLGPLTFDQIEELARDGVIARETYVWKQGMPDWSPAVNVEALRSALAVPHVEAVPPPTPVSVGLGTAPPPRPSSAPHLAAPAAGQFAVSPYGAWNQLDAALPISDKSRITAGLLNLIPGIGRIYLGYAAHGVLQLFTSVFCGVGYLWSIIDGVYILAGGVKYDGYGRLLQKD